MSDPPLCIVVMGVSGCGKSTVGRLIAEALDRPYLEGDSFHPPANVERMRAGIALTDEDRAPWLRALAGRLAQAHREGHGAVLACSALKRRYRDVLRGGAADLALVHLHGTRERLEARLAERRGHYMPASLLASQLEALEPPGIDELAITLDLALPPDRVAQRAIAWLRGCGRADHSHGT
jgi:carbohydrate kinase (thermoresistant glucokinase family)